MFLRNNTNFLPPFLAPEGHIVMIDPHGEYSAAFKQTGMIFDVSNLQGTEVVASMVVLVGAAASPAEALTAAPTITVTVPPQPITSTRDVAVTYQVSLKPTDLKLLQCGLTAPGSTVWIQKTCGIRTDINRKVTGSINFQGVPDGTYDVVVRAQGKTTALGEKRVRIQVAYVAPSSVPAQACAPYGTFLTGGDMSAFPPGSGFDDATYSVRWRCSGRCTGGRRGTPT